VSFLPDLRWGILVGYGPLFVQGLLMTLQLTVVSITGGLASASSSASSAARSTARRRARRSRRWRGSCCAA
jgi:polar amino acid transport system permease protein